MNPPQTMTTSFERLKPTPFPPSSTMSNNKVDTRSQPKYKPKENRLGKPRSISDILASPPPIKKRRDGVTTTNKKPASGRSLIMESLRGFDDDNDDGNFSLPVSSKAKGSSASVGGKPKKKKSNSFTGGRNKPPPIREDDESVTSVRSMPVGTKSSPPKKSRSFTGSRPTPRTISENTPLKHAPTKKPPGPKRGRKLDVLGSTDVGEKKQTRSSSLGAMRGARERVARKPVNNNNNNNNNNNDNSSVQSFRVKKHKPNYKVEKLDKATAFSVSLDGASTHSSRSMGIPARRRGGTNNGSSSTSRGRSRNNDSSSEKQVRSSSLGALQSRRASATIEKENQPVKPQLETETKPVKKQISEKTDNDGGTEANYKEDEVGDLPLKPAAADNNSKDSSAGRTKKKKDDGDDSEGSWGDLSAHSTKSLGRHIRRKKNKEDDASLGGSSLHSTKSVGRVGRRKERDNRIGKRPSSLGPLQEGRKNKKYADDAEDISPIDATQEGTETKKMVRSNSLGRLFGFGRKKSSDNSNEEDGNVTTSQPDGGGSKGPKTNSSDASIDGPSKATKLAKAKSGTERKRSSSVGPLDRGRRRSNSSGDRDKEDLTVSQSPKKGQKANKHVSMDGSSHTMKSGRAQKRSSSLGPLGNVERTRKDASMDSSSHTMKSARGRGRKKTSRQAAGAAELSPTISADATPNKEEGKPTFNKGSSSIPPKTSIDLHTSTDTFESVLTEDTFLEEATSPPVDNEEDAATSSDPDNTLKSITPANDTDTTESTNPEDEMKAKVAEMASMYFELKKKKASEVKELKAENDLSHDDAVGDDETTSAHRLLIPPRAGQNGSIRSELENVRNVATTLSTGEPTAEGCTESSIPGPAVTDYPVSIQRDGDDVASLRMEVVKKKEELLAAERAIFEKVQVHAMEERMLSLRKKEEMFAAERAAFEMEQKMFTKERQAAADDRLVKIHELEELLATERAKFQKEKETLTQEQRDALEKERAELQKEIDKKKNESESFLQEKQSLAQQLEDAKQRNEDFKRVLNILSKQLERAGSIQAHTDDHLLQVAGLTNANDEMVCDDEMFFEEEEEEG